MRGALALLATAIALPGDAHGCEMESAPAGWIDPPIRIAADCSFVEAASEFGVSFTGRTPVDIGGGRIGQRLSLGSNCGTDEEIVIADCGSGESISIRGEPDPGAPGTPDGEAPGRADNLYPPNGAIRLTASVSVAELAAVSAREGYRNSLDLDGRIRQMERHNRFDPFCGCGIFYPSSDGARR